MPQQIQVYPRIPEPKSDILDKSYILGAVEKYLKEETGSSDFEKFKNKNPSVVLDVACGIGLSAYHLALALPGAKVVGYDSDPIAIDFAQKLFGKKAANLRFETGNIYNLSRRFRDVADLVYCENSLHHFDNLAAAVSEIYTALKFGGEFYFLDLNRKSWNNYSDEMEMPDGRIVPAVAGIYELRTQISDEGLVRILLDGTLVTGNTLQDGIVRFLRIISRIAAYTPDEVEAVLKSAGFRKWLVADSLDPDFYSGAATK